MSYCLSIECQKPENRSNAERCATCRSKLLLNRRYRAIKLIGQGGFGRTFLAVDEKQRDKPCCVIKQFFPQATGETREKASELFAQEALRLEELGQHPQIPQLLAYLHKGKQQYLIQEFIDGISLDETLQKGVWEEEQVKDLLTQLLPVLEAIHCQNIIHRDIKPANIIRHHDGKIVLVDFGASKIASGTALLKTGTVIGTAEYVAPEQLRGKANYSSDIYSLGVTCISMLTGISPFNLFNDVTGDWAWQDYLNQPVSNHLSQIINKMVALPQKERYASAQFVLNDLSSSSLRVNNNRSSKLKIFKRIAITTVAITVLGGGTFAGYKLDTNISVKDLFQLLRLLKKSSNKLAHLNQ